MISSLVDVVFLLPEVFVYRMRYFKAKSVPIGADSGLGLDPVYLPPEVYKGFLESSLDFQLASEDLGRM